MLSTGASLPDGSILLHIGPGKTGTTSLQGALYRARDAMAAQGVHFVGASQHESTAALYAAHQDDPTSKYRGSAWRWMALARSARGTSGRAILSSERLAHAMPAAVERIVDQAGGSRVQVVVTLRSVGRILPSYWQQTVAGGATHHYEAWLRAVLDGDGRGSTSGFWQQHRHDELVARWIDVAGRDRVRVVVVDERDHDVVLRAFEQLLALESGTLHAATDADNRSLTQPEVEALRALNAQSKAAGLDPGRYRDLVYLGAQRYLKRSSPGPDEPRIWTPPWALEAVAAIDASIVDGLRRLGVQVLGDLDRLALPLAAGDAPRLPVEMVPADVAGRLGIGLLTATGAAHTASRSGGLAYLTGRATEPGITAGVSTAALAGVLANRIIRSVTSPIGRWVARLRGRG